MRKQVFSLLVNNNAGLLSRVAGLFSRRGYSLSLIHISVLSSIGVEAAWRYAWIRCIWSPPRMSVMPAERARSEKSAWWSPVRYSTRQSSSRIVGTPDAWATNRALCVLSPIFVMAVLSHSNRLLEIEVIAKPLLRLPPNAYFAELYTACHS